MTIFRKIRKSAQQLIPTQSDKLVITAHDIETQRAIYKYLDFYRYEYTTTIYGDILITANFDGLEFSAIKTGLANTLGFRNFETLYENVEIRFLPSRDRLAS